MSSDQINIMRLQDNLNTLRKIGGWSAQELGEKIGVTKQTISNLENKKTELTRLQYMGLRRVFAFEAKGTSESAKLLKLALKKILDEELSEEENVRYESRLRYAAAAIAKGATASEASETYGFSEEALKGYIVDTKYDLEEKFKKGLFAEEITIMRLQENLEILRKIAGWTQQDLGEKIGVTKQTINNLECKKSTMTKLHYLVLRTVFDYEVISSPEDTRLLKLALEKLIDEELPEDEKKEYESRLWYASLALAEGAKKEEVAEYFKLLEAIVFEETEKITEYADTLDSSSEVKGWLDTMIGNDEK